MAKMYECWFPERGEERQAHGRTYLADSFEQAAEYAAKECCQKEVEWRDRKVNVALGQQVKRFDVEVQSMPVFAAHPLTASI